tara:strand:+ start:7987 stop:8910 length:924 start_codon:yes stop_codon:yes gene_type:complete
MSAEEIENNIEEGEVVEIPSEDVSEPAPSSNDDEPEVVEAQSEDESQGDDELGDYSERVKKRIANLTRRLREEERAKDSAFNYAQQLQEENKSLRYRSSSLDRSYLAEAENRLKSQRAQAQAALKNAHEVSDFDKVAKAQDILAKIAVEESKILQSKSQVEYQDQVEQNNQQVIYNEPQGYQQNVPSYQTTPSEPDPKAQSWADKNTWFGEDETMTLAAFNIHRKLVEEEGFDPKSDEYYTEVDSRIRLEFPHKFDVKKPQQRVASASRADTKVKGSKKQVKLSPSEVAMAKKLNVPLSEYAKHVKR